MSGSRAGRRPDPAVDAAILRAAVELMVERGYDLTFDAVAARAGVGRTSVFRRYATKHDLLMAAAETVSIDRIEVPDTGSLRGDLATAFAAVFEIFGQEPLRSLARHMLTVALQEQPGAEIVRGILDRRLGLVTEVLERAVERGELPDAARARLVADLLSGVIMARMVTGVALPTDEELQATVAAAAVAAGAARAGG